MIQQEIKFIVPPEEMKEAIKKHLLEKYGIDSDVKNAQSIRDIANSGFFPQTSYEITVTNNIKSKK